MKAFGVTVFFFIVIFLIGSDAAPYDHIESKVVGLQSNGSSTLRDILQYDVGLKDNVYSGLMPVSCKYYNPSNPSQNINLVVDGCPQFFPVDPEGYFQTMQRTESNKYAADFRAFAFQTTDALLGIDCDILLCVESNKADCEKACWGDESAVMIKPDNIKYKTDPVSITINEKIIFKINVPASA